LIYIISKANVQYTKKPPGWVAFCGIGCSALYRIMRRDAAALCLLLHMVHITSSS